MALHRQHCCVVWFHTLWNTHTHLETTNWFAIFLPKGELQRKSADWGILLLLQTPWKQCWRGSEHWRQEVAHNDKYLVVGACTLSFSVISTPKTMPYLQKYWNDLWQQMVRGSPDYQMARFMAQYALAWAMRSQDLGKALLKVKTCYKDMKKDNLDNFFLAPYYTVTIGRWIFEANEHNLSDGVITKVDASSSTGKSKIREVSLMILRTSTLRFSICIKRSVKNCLRIISVWSCMIRHGFTVLVRLTISLLTTLQLPRKRKTVCMPLASVLLLNLHISMTEMAMRSHEEAERADNPDLICEYAKHGRSAPPVWTCIFELLNLWTALQIYTCCIRVYFIDTVYTACTACMFHCSLPNVYQLLCLCMYL